MNVNEVNKVLDLVGRANGYYNYITHYTNNRENTQLEDVLKSFVLSNGYNIKTVRDPVSKKTMFYSISNEYILRFDEKRNKVYFIITE